jgi:hypothetical protein
MTDLSFTSQTESGSIRLVAMVPMGFARRKRRTRKAWDVDDQRGPASSRTRDLDRSANRRHSIYQPDESRPAAGSRSADSVIANREVNDPVLRFELDAVLRTRARAWPRS